ncbi:16S rRNA (uracil(1498)-N(3))-methyltransferase [Evansella cellulosilytica]|uniref:Ribosomal RNA small subunit methyltransferase E n=1 Tax=Evansella cellulosilytica (strain ATCC 21833 / DSM 2522 / FERM P-1141 / JCM 9156 / N-4) TaxID=649639 RepID=E6TW31_EVAC2|nr:16S rRNA (uracil(1498)-N(3))-methyltransferase [Evansella cellulosilytica]ADU29854.1 protein of unknown function DUF558 [Evansella cellulosilytica DSM 2522]
MQRYFINPQMFHEDHVVISGDDAKHISRVMRMEQGDNIICCTTSGVCYECVISEMKDSYIYATIEKQESKSVELPVNVTIGHGLPKGDKFEWVIQKGTELGAKNFLPFEAERSIVKLDKKKADKKIDRWNKIAKEAAEQSHRQQLPKVMEVQRFSQLLDHVDGYSYVLVAYEEAAKNDEKSQLFSVLQEVKKGESILFLFGPEGGFSDREINELTKKGALICGLGPRILRSETAPLYGLTAISYHLELLG